MQSPGRQQQFSGTIDVKRTGEWLRNCDRHHKGKCYDVRLFRNLQPPPSLLLINVEKACLEQVKGSTRYAALSYVWGRLDNILETTVSNKDILHQPGSLLKPLGDKVLPNTVRDAINLASTLHIPYVWVDRLCIVQDDHDSKRYNLEQMGSIYLNSYVTLIAAEGEDANFGLRGTGGQSQPREPHKINHSRAPVGVHFDLVRRPDKDLGRFRADPSTNIQKQWHGRGWTFQENMLSQRKLVFLGGTVYWECVHGLQFEDVVSFTDDDDLSRDRSMPHSLDRFDKVYEYERVDAARGENVFGNTRYYNKAVGHFTTRTLSFQTDALEAFTGVLSFLMALYPCFQEGFFYGLPENGFHQALRWRLSAPPQRPIALIEGRPYFPSWSWVGKESSISFEHDLTESKDYYPVAKCDRVDVSTGACSRIPKWFTHDYVHSAQRYGPRTGPVSRTGVLQIEAEIGIFNMHLLDDGSSRRIPLRFVNFAVEHPKFPGRPFGVVLGDEREIDTPLASGQSCMLMAMGVRRSDIEPHDSNEEKPLSPAEVQALDSMSRQRGEGFSYKERLSMPRASLRMSHGVIQYFKRSTSNTYEVMWIVEKDGVMYRKGSGYVNFEAWNRLNLRPSVIVMG